MKELKFFTAGIKYIEGLNEADISFIPKLALRRMSSLDKITAAALKTCFCNETDFILYASKTGEIERLNALIEGYTLENEVSPAVFSDSVHNAPAGVFLINEKKSIPYNSLAAGSDTFAAGLFASAAADRYSDILYVYSDIEDEKYVSMCLRIVKTGSIKYGIKLSSSKKAVFPRLKDYYALFKGAVNAVQTPDYKIERLEHA